jgi:hypothetical protein
MGRTEASNAKEETMQKCLNCALAVVVAVAVFASVAMLAQTRLLEREYRILSGNDVGFRIEGTDAAGRPVGTFMVRVDGKWVEVSPMPTLRRVN